MQVLQKKKTVRARGWTSCPVTNCTIKQPDCPLSRCTSGCVSTIVDAHPNCASTKLPRGTMSPRKLKIGFNLNHASLHTRTLVPYYVSIEIMQDLKSCKQNTLDTTLRLLASPCSLSRDDILAVSIKMRSSLVLAAPQCRHL